MQVERTFISSSITVPTSWGEIGDELSVSGSTLVTVILNITPGSATTFELRARLRRTPGGVDYPEQMYDGSLIVLSDRTHTLNVPASGECYAVIQTSNFPYLQLEAQFDVATTINSGYVRLSQ